MRKFHNSGLSRAIANAQRAAYQNGYKSGEQAGYAKAKAEQREKELHWCECGNEPAGIGCNC